MNAHVFTLSSSQTVRANSESQQPKLCCICWRRILSFLFSFHSFLFGVLFLPIYIRTWESRDYFQIYNGYLLICVVLSARGLTCTLWMCNTAYRRRDLYNSRRYTQECWKAAQSKTAVSFFESKYENETGGNRFYDVARFELMIVHYCLVCSRSMAQVDSYYTIHNESGLSESFPYVLMQSKSTYSPNCICSVALLRLAEFANMHTTFNIWINTAQNPIFSNPCDRNHILFKERHEQSFLLFGKLWMKWVWMNLRSE